MTSSQPRSRNWKQYVSQFVLTTTCYLCLIAVIGSSTAFAQPRVLRIGTGGSAGSYFPIGSLIAQALSQRESTSSEQTMVQNDLLLLAQRSSGSVANVTEIQSGLLESGLAQADVAHWAYHGTGPFASSSGLDKLRTVASLYLESLHLIARTDADIHSIDDLTGHRVSVDEVGSGTQLDIAPILEAFKVRQEEIKIVYLKPTDAIDRIRRDQLDAFFVVAGFPVSGITELVAEDLARVVPITGPAIDKLVAESPFFVRDTFPRDTYANSDAIPTVSVAAQWIVSADLDPQLVYQLTNMLWHPDTTNILSDGHPKGREVRLNTALIGISIPLHPGARRFYEEAGLPTTALPH